MYRFMNENLALRMEPSRVGETALTAVLSDGLFILFLFLQSSADDRGEGDSLRTGFHWGTVYISEWDIQISNTPRLRILFTHGPATMMKMMLRNQR